MKKILIISLSFLVLVFGFLSIYPHLSHKMPYKRVTVVYSIEKPNKEYDYTKSQIREKLENLTGVSLYFYKERTLPSGQYGRTLIMFRKIEVEQSLPTKKYIEVMCHELLHLKHLTLNERFITYQTFVCLYNSEFKEVAIDMLYGMKYGEYLYEYDCHAQILEYLGKQPI